MLQQDRPEDFVIATGVQYSVREFVQYAAAELGVTVRFEGSGVDEVGIVDKVEGRETRMSPGDVIVRVDPRYFRPTEVETLLGDPSKAHAKLGWQPKTPFISLVREMVRADFQIARRDALVTLAGFKTLEHHE
jgi:GDPmannose 4,6-dehydratase